MTAMPLTGLNAHLAPNECAGLIAFVDELRSRYSDDVMRVVLFGSKARGDSQPDSDMDLLVVLRMEPGEYRRHWNELVDLVWDVQFQYGVIISFILKDGPGFSKMQRDGLLIAHDIERDGINLWTSYSLPMLSDS